MTAQRTGGVQWRKTSVLIRTDIFARAEEEGIDLSSECNRALAGLLGIDYRQQKIPQNAPVTPVIIAKEPAGRAGGSGDGGRKKPLRPVLNADDPLTPAHVLKLKIEPAPAEGQQAAVKGGRRSPQKKGKDDLIRQFLRKKILRTEPGEGEANRIAKDEMYQIFVRWCRAKPGGAVADKRTFSVALKNRFVMEESTADSTQYWNNVKLR
jgi:hypothetical protein